MLALCDTLGLYDEVLELHDGMAPPEASTLVLASILAMCVCVIVLFERIPAMLKEAT